MSGTPSQPSSPTTRIELFTHEPMVNWLGPTQLLKTGIRVAVAATFGSFADARLVQGALNPPQANPPLDLTNRDSLWLDFVADTGDGWDSTYSIAYSISRDSLIIDNTTLPRADLLVLGGDQVYPTPAESAYRTRFLDPFRAAFPSDVPPLNPPGDPKLIAIPGNHDWYDGLRGFLQLFCVDQYIGRWKTIQRTSYFAVKLPCNWWLFGIDLQLDSGIDTEQYKYFKGIVETHIKAGDRVILLPPEPSWIDESERLRRQRTGSLAQIETQAPRFRDLKRIESLIESSPGRLAAVMAGDLHHYAHYERAADSPDAPERITCGGGGAYLIGTHDLPEDIRFVSGAGEQHYKLRTTFPDAKESRRLRNQAVLLPLRNFVFCSLLAGVYLLYAWVLQSASRVPRQGLENVSLMQYLSRLPSDLHGLLQIPSALLQTVAHSPSSVAFTLAIIASAAAFTARSVKEKKKRAWVGGALHGVLHLTLALLLLNFASHINLNALAPMLGRSGDMFVDEPLQILCFIVEIAVLGGGLGGLLFGSWLVATNAWFRWHSDEVFSSQGIADYKSFLRMRLDAQGLTIYPLKVAKVCRSWKIGERVALLSRMGRSWRLRTQTGSHARFLPTAPIIVEAIEPPFRVR